MENSKSAVFLAALDVALTNETERGDVHGWDRRTHWDCPELRKVCEIAVRQKHKHRFRAGARTTAKRGRDAVLETSLRKATARRAPNGLDAGAI